MIDQRALTFVRAAELGSFSKAASSLYLSPVSVMKQMDAFEAEVGVQLFIRSHAGCKLTSAGESLLTDIKRIRDESDAAIARARAISQSGKSVIRLGTSLLRPCRPLMDLIARNTAQLPYRIEIVPFSDDEESLRRTIGALGESIDCFVGPVGSRAFVEEHGVLVLGSWDCCIAMSRDHPLAVREKLSWDDLAGQKLMLVRRGESYVLDRMRDEISNLHTDVEVVDVPYFYDANVFNVCERHGVMMETLEAWADVHPGVVTLPMDWGYQMPFGVVYAKAPSETVMGFIDSVAAML